MTYEYQPADTLMATSAALTGVGEVSASLFNLFTSFTETASLSLNKTPPRPDWNVPLLYRDQRKIFIAGLSRAAPEPEVTYLATPPVQRGAGGIGLSPIPDVQVSLRNVSDGMRSWVPGETGLPIERKRQSRFALVEVRIQFSSESYPDRGSVAEMSYGTTANGIDFEYNPATFVLYPSRAWS